MYEFKFPDVGEGIHEGRIIKWLVNEGDIVKEDQNIVEIETDKALVEVPTPKSGRILKILAKESETINVGQTLVMIGDEGEKPELNDEVLASPHVRKLAQELNLDLSKIKGTGEGGIILEEDVRRTTPVTATPATVERQTKITFDTYGRAIRIPFVGIRKTISEHLLMSVRNAVQVTHFDEADVTKLAELRSRKKEESQKQGYSLTYLPFIAKAVELALKDNPYLNSSLDEKTGEIILKQYYNIGFAVDIADGLLVPVIKNIDKKGIMQIAKEMKSLSDQCRSREISLEDMKGSTFTITNIGSIGGIHFTPILNYPESAILGVGRLIKKIILENGAVKEIQTLPLSLTFDHRLLDGARAARFVNDLVKYLENPEETFNERF